MAYMHLFRRRGAALPRMAPLDIFHVETGGCTGCALELRALGRGLVAASGAVRFVATPRQAGMLLLTGSLTVEMAPVVEMAWQAMPGRVSLPWWGTARSMADCSHPITPRWAGWAPMRAPAFRYRAARPRRKTYWRP